MDQRVVPPPTRTQVLAAAAALGAATVVVAAVDPHEGHFPVCPLLAVTGLYCPFCGGLRAVHDLTHLDVGGALARNPLVVVGLPFVVLALVAWGQQAFTARRVSLPAALWPALLGVLVVFGVLRNLPGWTWLSPA